MTVGEKIKKYRLELGMTQEQLGRELGVGKAAVQKYESNQVQNLKSSHIKKLCVLFNRRPWDFIFDEESNDTESLENVPITCEKIRNESLQLLEILASLNETGRNKVKEYINDISKIDEYRKSST